MMTKLQCQKEMTVYVERKLDSFMKQHELDVKLNYYLHREYSSNEYNEMIREIEEKMENPPKEKITPTDDMILIETENANPLYVSTEDEILFDEDIKEKKRILLQNKKRELEKMLREAYINDCKHQIKLIEHDMKKSEDFRIFYTAKKRELENYPKNIEEVIVELRNYIIKEINYYHKDLVDSYFEMFVDKIDKLCPDDKDYTKTISSVYRCKNSKKAMDIIWHFFDIMKTSLITLSMNIKRCKSEEYYKMYMLLKTEFKKLIDTMHLTIYNFIKMQIDYIDEESEMSNSQVVKIYSESCMSQLNQALISDLPSLLDEEFKIRIQDRIENLEYIWKQQIGYEFNCSKSISRDEREVVSELHEPKSNVINTIVEINNKPLVAKVVKKQIITPTLNISIESFLETLPNESIEVNDLTEMYNKYFGTNVTPRGFGMLKFIKDSFTKVTKVVCGKKITYYLKT